MEEVQEVVEGFSSLVPKYRAENDARSSLNRINRN